MKVPTRAQIVPTMSLTALSLLFASSALAQGLPPVPQPPENPITESKRVLGKILFWDEQLSADNTMACGTCHIPSSAGADPRVGLNPGPDTFIGTPDDIFASPGVIHSDAQADYLRDSVFGTVRQVTGRTAPPSVMAMYAPNLFWDGRATSAFTDPQTGQVAIAIGGALESQVVGPPLSSAEMAHESRNWTQITDKLTSAVPLALATNIPSDMTNAIAANPTYRDLFASAFGDSAINSRRIAFAIATYERTLVPDQTPWDAFVAGVPGAMTPGQVQGWNFFRNSPCAICHTPPLFTNNTFRNIGMRPPVEDTGRQAITGNPGDLGRFKVPTIRNVGLKSTFMHNGQITNLAQVLDHYRGANGQPIFPQNVDPIMPVPVPPFLRTPLIDFMANALTDPRVASEAFPFDRPTLQSERAANPVIITTGTPGTGGFVPTMIAVTPPNVGNFDFKLGIDHALGGANCFMAISSSPPVGNELIPDELLGPFILDGASPDTGLGTFHWPIPADSALNGQTRYFQWIVQDPQGVAGVALSPVARIDMFCGSSCPPGCAVDMNNDGSVDVLDFFAFITAFNALDPAADLNNDGGIDVLDFFAFIIAFDVGCA